MTPESLLAAAVTVAAVLIAQHFQNRRSAREQDAKREELAARLAAERREDEERHGKERRQELADILERMAEQNSSVVANAVRLAEVHQQDAERARLLAIDNATAHAECRQEVAHLAGQVGELKARQAENERTMGDQIRLGEEDRKIKHDAFTALTASEGTLDLVKDFVADCECDAYRPVHRLVTSFHPRAPALLEANLRLRPTGLAGVAAGIDRIEAAQEQVAADLVVAQSAVDGVATDLEDAHRRADATDGPAGEAADAFTRGPDDQPLIQGAEP